jgi:hypothetical protein
MIYEGVDWIYLAPDCKISLLVAVHFEHRPTSIHFSCECLCSDYARCDVVRAREAETRITFEYR